MTWYKKHGLSLAGIFIGSIGLVLWYISHLSTRDATLSRKINSSLDLLATCGYDSLNKEQIEETLLQAKKSLDIDGNYGVAADLINSINWELRACNPTLEANQDLMIITVLAMMILAGIVTLFRNRKKTNTNTANQSP